MNLHNATTVNPQAINQIYNVALNEKTSLNDLYQIIEEGIIKRVNGLERSNLSTEISEQVISGIHRLALKKQKALRVSA